MTICRSQQPRPSSPNQHERPAGLVACFAILLLLGVGHSPVGRAQSAGIDPQAVDPATQEPTAQGGITMVTGPATGPVTPSAERLIWRKAQVSQLLLDNSRQRLTIFSFALAYSGQAPQTFTFATGQRYDFLILDTAGNVRWRWSSSRMFTQMIGTETLSHGDLRIYQVIWNGRDDEGHLLPPGDYFLQAVWTTTPLLTCEPVPFHVGS